MKVYKFVTRISEKGTIQIPNNPSLFNTDAEIFIVPKSNNKKDKIKATEFVKKWAGFLKDSDTDKSKYEYLSDKYK